MSSKDLTNSPSPSSTKGENESIKDETKSLMIPSKLVKGESRTSRIKAFIADLPRRAAKSTDTSTTIIDSKEVEVGDSPANNDEALVESEESIKAKSEQSVITKDVSPTSTLRELPINIDSKAIKADSKSEQKTSFVNHKLMLQTAPLLPIIRDEDMEAEPDQDAEEPAKQLEGLALNQSNIAQVNNALAPKPPLARSTTLSTFSDAFPAVSPMVSPNLKTTDPSQVVPPSAIDGRRPSNAAVQRQNEYRNGGLRRFSGTMESRRTSNAGLQRMDSNVMSSEADITVYSEATNLRFSEDDRRLEQFVATNEAKTFETTPASNIPTDVPDELKHGSYSFDCSFGWVGDKAVDLEATPLNPESYIEKLDDAKDGIRFVQRALINYQAEINARGHHKFTAEFLAHQNNACFVTFQQLIEIDSHLNKVVDEIKAVSEDDPDLAEKLKAAYNEALPWVQRTGRLLCETHIFYKLNYVLGRQQKTTKVKKPVLPTIPAGRVAPDI